MPTVRIEKVLEEKCPRCRVFEQPNLLELQDLVHSKMIGECQEIDFVVDSSPPRNRRS
jgi:hypothetical protein